MKQQTRLKAKDILFNRYPNTNPPMWRHKKADPHLEGQTLDQAKLENTLLAAIADCEGISLDQLSARLSLPPKKVLAILKAYRNAQVIRDVNGQWFLV